MSKQISVVVPCFNEEKTIYQNIKKIADYLQAKFDKFEIIVVNDGSIDNTSVELLKLKRGNFSVKIINYKRNEGKGKVVRDGILKSKYSVLMFLDADLGIPIEELEKFLVEIRKGYDIVIASRFIPGLKIKRPVKWHRKLMEKGFRLLRILIINDWRIKDTQCGFKVFKKEVAMSIFPKLTVKRFAFDAELIFVASKKKFKIKELPVTLQNSPNSHVRIIRDPLNMTLDLIKIKVNHLKKKYK